jgi:hypothetical protein
MIFECVLKTVSIENQVMILSKKEKEKNLVYPWQEAISILFES